MMRSILSFVLAILAVSGVHSFTGYTPVFAKPPAVQTSYVGCSRGLVMRARECDLLGKTANRKARVISFSHVRNKTVQHVNLQWKRFFSEQLGRNVRLRLSTKGIKTVDRMGNIDAAAKKFELDLTKF